MKKIFQLSFHLIITAFFLFGLASCMKDYFDMDKIADTKWTPKVALPMVYSSLTISDIIKMSKSEGLFQIGSDNFITLIYKGNILSLRADEVIQLPDNSNSTDIFVPAPDFPIVGTGGTSVFNSSQTINFNTGGQTQIDSLIYKSGTLDITVNSNVQHNVQILLSIPSLKKNGIAYSSTMSLNYTGTLPVNATSSVGLSGYVFDMTQGGTTTNQFNVDYSITVNGLAGNPISSSDNINIATNFNQNKFDKLFGFIGQISLLPNPDTVGITLFKNATGIGIFTLENPKIKVLMSNSFGVPILGRIKGDSTLLSGYNPGATNNVNLQLSPQIPDPLPLSSPSILQIGQVLQDSFEMNDAFVKAFIESLPKNLVYQVNAIANPDTIPKPWNFVLDSSRLSVDMELEMPLHGTAIVFTVQDTFPFQLPQGDEIDSLLLRIHVANGFPLDVNMQIYFVDTEITSFDTLYHVLDFALDSSKNTNILNAAPIDGNGKAIGKVEKDIDQWLDAKKLSNMAKAEQIFIRGNMTTIGGNKSVRIYSDYKLDVKIGVMAKLKQTVSFH